MLHYRRRNSDEPLPEIKTNRHPFLTYVNWSYDKNQHFDTEQLRNMLSAYNERYVNIYFRIFNEIPRNVVESFMEQENLDTAILADIYRALSHLNLDLRPF